MAIAYIAMNNSYFRYKGIVTMIYGKRVLQAIVKLVVCIGIGMLATASDNPNDFCSF